MKNYPFKVLLGYIKDTKYPVFLRGFEWDCNWYYGGGYIGNNNFHAHFDGAFLDTPDVRGHCLGNFCTPWDTEKLKNGYKAIDNGASIWEDLDFFLDDAKYTPQEWWRIKDLYKQFYVLRQASEVLQYGGHCTASGRTEAEINKPMAEAINTHIQDVIIPEIVKALKVDVRQG
jgi:hypothetical protein